MVKSVMIGINICAGLCNRIFQIVFAYAFSKKNNLKFRFENWNKNSHHSYQTYPWLIDRFTRLENYVSEPVQYKYHCNEEYEVCTTYLDYYSSIKNLIPDNVLIQGFFQNEKYFIEYKDEILELLKEPEYITTIINTHYKKEYLNNSYFLHIRLGDYINHPKHWIFLEDYYLKILNDIYHKDVIIMIFCNDLNNLPHIYPKLFNYLQTINHILIKDPDEVINLYLMSRCKLGGICSNSTFGWWGAWLNQNPDKKVFFPSQWMADKNFKTDIYPEKSIVISV